MAPVGRPCTATRLAAQHAVGSRDIAPPLTPRTLCQLLCAHYAICRVRRQHRFAQGPGLIADSTAQPALQQLQALHQTRHHDLVAALCRPLQLPSPWQVGTGAEGARPPLGCAILLLHPHTLNCAPLKLDITHTSLTIHCQQVVLVVQTWTT